MHTAVREVSGAVSRPAPRSCARCEVLELLIQRGYSLLEHPFVHRRARAAQVVASPRSGQFEYPPAFFQGPFLGRQVRPYALPAAGGFLLLGFDRLGFKPSRHTFIVRWTDAVLRMSLAGTYNGST